MGPSSTQKKAGKNANHTRLECLAKTLEVGQAADSSIR